MYFFPNLPFICHLFSVSSQLQHSIVIKFCTCFIPTLASHSYPILYMFYSHFSIPLLSNFVHVSFPLWHPTVIQFCTCFILTSASHCYQILYMFHSHSGIPLSSNFVHVSFQLYHHTIILFFRCFIPMLEATNYYPMLHAFLSYITYTGYRLLSICLYSI